MKRLVSILCAVLSMNCVHSGELEKESQLVAKVALSNTQGYFLFEDGSFWKVVPLIKRWRSLSEWWNDVQLVPEQFECIPKDWNLGAPIAVYRKESNFDIEESNASNSKILKHCSHFLVNQVTKQTLFAYPLSQSQLITQLYRDAYLDGYNIGQQEGIQKQDQMNQQTKTKIHQEGYTKGYQSGYETGYRDGLKKKLA